MSSNSKKDSSSSGAKKRRIPRVRCGECDACTRADCGKCRCCVRKKKFGGDDSCKEACVHRRCKNLRERIMTTTTTTTTPNNDTASSEEKMKKPKLQSDSPCYMYGIQQTKCIVDACAGCGGTRNAEFQDEPILLCDGEGCSREYHMSCCIPPLTDVPEGAFYCVDCDPVGITYRQLEQYLEAGAEARADYTTSREYVESLLLKHVEELSSSSTAAASEEESSTEHKNGDDEEISNKSSDTSKKKSATDMKKSSSSEGKRQQRTKLRIPNSELWGIAESHQNAMCDTEKFATATTTTRTSDVIPQIRPDFLVGKPLRLYCPVGNNYHDGRIVDWRKATHLHPIESGEPFAEDAFYGNTDISDCEFHVRFLAGMNERKKTMHAWIILEEHSLAVGISLIWGEFGRSKGINAWKPAQTLLRTSLELVPVCHLLNEQLNQISFTTVGETPDEKLLAKQGNWALAKQLGHESYTLLELANESVDAFSEGFSKHFFHGKSSSSSNTKEGGQSETARVLDLNMALAFAESEEQRRVRKWYSMPLNNAAHKQALTIADESALPPLELSNTKDTAKEDKNPHRPKLCPSIERGLDRKLIMKLLGNKEKVEQSLDTGASLTCELVGCSPGAISQFREAEKR